MSAPTIATTLTYTFTQRWIAECLAMMVVISVGDSVIANEVLSRTKGHALGLGHVSVGFGMAFFIAIAMFGGISAACNPAMLLAKVSFHCNGRTHRPCAFADHESSCANPQRRQTACAFCTCEVQPAFAELTARQPKRRQLPMPKEYCS